MPEVTTLPVRKAFLGPHRWVHRRTVSGLCVSTTGASLAGIFREGGRGGEEL